MDVLARHVILVAGETAEEGEIRIRHFFDQTSLVRYDRLDFTSGGLSATDPCFVEKLQQAIAENRRLLDGFITELGTAGGTAHRNLADIEQGYQSKILHIIAHFLDGFVGIDSAFYNLVDDSHWLSEVTAAALAESPEHYWLFALAGYSMTPREAALLHHHHQQPVADQSTSERPSAGIPS